MSSRAEIERLVGALYEAYNAHDADAAAGLYADDGRHAEVALGNERVGAAAIADGLAGFLRAFPDARWEERARIASGSRAAVTYRLTGTLKAPFGPFEPAGQRLELSGVHVLEESEGSIAVCEDFWDAATFHRQMRGAA